jgi:serralysin
MTAEGQWCLAWAAQRTGPVTRAALDRRAKWQANILNIFFMDADADPTLVQRVRVAAKGWTGPDAARLTFAFVRDVRQAQIRISFKQPGSWSVLGNTAKQVPIDKPTMNFGWLKPDSTDAQLRSVVLHEFGHALGLIHEHQNPGGIVPWNRPQVYGDLAGPPHFWDTTKVDRNFFNVYDKTITNHTDVDQKSIMMYPIAENWVTERGFARDLNADLSDTDRRFIREQYK